MDKQEYKILSEEIMALVANERFVDAVEIADRIDWRKVRSFSTLQKISELYRINCRFDEAMDIMLMAYDKNPNSRTIVYSLCELSIDLDDLVAALQYLALYKKMAPGDKGGLILQYRILEMQNAKTEEKIELLEELNHKDYTEEWAYQLAYLYHRIGLATKCVETCDQLITWFGYGPFVIKAIELKMLHAPLTDKQKEIYDSRNDISEQIEAYESDDYTVERAESSVAADMGTEDFHVKTIDMGKFNTINLQKALAESMRELMGEDMDESEESPLVSTGELEQRIGDTQYFGSRDRADYRRQTPQEAYPEDNYEASESGETYAEDSYEPVEDGEVYPEDGYGPMEDGEVYPEDGYEPMEGGEVYPEDGYGPVEDGEVYPEDGYGPAEDGEVYPEDGYEPIENKEVYSENGYQPVEKGETYPEEKPQVSRKEDAFKEDDGDEVFFEDKTEDIIIDVPPAGTVMPGQTMINAKMKETFVKEQQAAGSAPLTKGQQEDDATAVSVEAKREENTAAEEPQSEAKPVVLAEEHHRVEKAPVSSVFDNVLSQGMDGQISLVVPEDIVVEKQITGQMNLQELFLEWENVKKRKEEERRAKTSKDIIQETGKIFAEFEAGARTGPLAKIEEERKMFASKFQNNEIELRSVDALEKISYTQGSIWDEVDAAIEADKKKLEGDIPVEEEEDVTAVAGDGTGPAIGAAALAGAAVGTVVGAAAGIAAEAALAEGVTGDLSAIGQAASAVLNGEGYHEALAAEQAVDASMMMKETVDEGYDAESGVTEDPSAEEYYASEDAATEEDFAQEYGSEDWSGEQEYVSEEAVSEEYVLEEAYEGYEEELSGQTAPINEQVLSTSQIEDIESALEAQADKVGADTADEDNDNYNGEEEHYLTLEEQELFSDFMYSKKMRNQILDAIDQISLAPYVGNIIITGDSGTGVIELAKTMIKEIQMIDNNFSASKVAKISGDKMNRKDLAAMFEQLTNGALIIERAGAMTRDTLEGMSRILEGFQEGIIIIMTDRKKEMEKLIDKYDMITGYFNARIDIKPMNDNALVDYAKKYAHTREYKIDEERAVLALHRRINELQIGEHNVTTREVEDIIDEAIERSKRLRFSTYVDVLVGKRYDYEDMIILKEKDFD
ncbi:MAG: hypothetical protein K2K96_01135 [Lachnospiraceae bacterium]|nr:hypothetical protein [Lachnospiraceae bacterium]